MQHYQNPERIRKLDPFAKFYWSDERCVYDRVIDNPEGHLLTQSDLYDEEGGIMNVLTQVGVIGLAYAGILMYQPALAKTFLKGNFTFYNWLLFSSAGAVGYRLGYELGVASFGNSEKVNGHWAAFYYLKTQNRFNGRTTLMKAPRLF